jgi:hypothetical protein
MKNRVVRVAGTAGPVVTEVDAPVAEAAPEPSIVARKPRKPKKPSVAELASKPGGRDLDSGALEEPTPADRQRETIFHREG